MKTIAFLTSGIIAIFLVIYVGTNKGAFTKATDNSSTIMTFDGYEGGHYFFTDEDGKSLDLNESLGIDLDWDMLQENETVGDTYRVDKNDLYAIQVASN